MRRSARVSERAAGHDDGISDVAAPAFQCTGDRIHKESRSSPIPRQ